ncbi:hypothetical protein F2P81_014359 [Scophthalmus maximus]|uniref:Uncharacterized protein n=1 Tax=Scophthalmus maximus TaxID=52904 RepID=A0A6A4SJJ2_SCOMX|nr:hypothetical protein F2P81_014359 [Scophthalmus maximus]
MEAGRPIVRPPEPLRRQPAAGNVKKTQRTTPLETNQREKVLNASLFAMFHNWHPHKLRSTAQKYCSEVQLRSTAQKYCSEVLLRSAAQKYFSEVLLRSTAQKYCSEVQLACTAQKYCSEVQLRSTAQKYCSEVLPRSTAQKSCSEVLLRSTAQKSCSTCGVDVQPRTAEHFNSHSIGFVKSTVQ